MRYDRKLKYLEYRERGEKLKGIGFVKLEVRDESCNLLIHIRGMHETDTYHKKIYLVGAGREELLCEIPIEKGCGHMELPGLLCHNLGDTGISYEQLDSILIPLGTGREIYGRIADSDIVQPEPPSHIRPENLTVKDEETQEEETTKQEKQEIPEEGIPEALEEEAPQAPKEGIPEALEEEAAQAPEESIPEVPEEEAPQAPEESIPEAPKEKAAQAPEESIPELEKQSVRGNHSGRERNMRQIDVMAADKWCQLVKIYPHIAPFGDEREFLSIGPGDFVVLPEKYYPMVNNSFLLHGYYNYHHLILCRRKSREGNIYYIGVPGNFYEKEKQVAVLFGFESFECAEEPAQAGDYGYYMMRIIL